MTDFEAYQEYIQRKHNAFCKAVIRYAARDKILQLRRKWERQISLDYLMDEKFVQFAGAGATVWALDSQICSGNIPAFAPNPKSIHSPAAYSAPLSGQAVAAL